MNKNHYNLFDRARLELKKTCTYSYQLKCEQIFCKLHDEQYLGGHENTHVCIACALNESLEKVYIFLKENKSKNNLEYSFTVYIMLLYLLVERLTTLFKVIGITQEYVETNWQVLVQIRKWANFFKHPKAFLLTHHPAFITETEEIPEIYKGWTRLDYESFVKKYYSKENEDLYKELMKKYANKNHILVILPRPEMLARELNEVCIEFVEKIRINPHFKEVLKDRTVIENYIY